jgi:hypothetical protein
MPNDCHNRASLSHNDTKKIDALEKELLNGERAEPFEHLRPQEKNQPEDHRLWRCENWGTKWDAYSIEWEREDPPLSPSPQTQLVTSAPSSIVMSFQTAWSPPIALYKFLEETEGWTIHAMYSELQWGFAGKYAAGQNIYNEFNVCDRDSLVNIPEDVLEFSHALDFNEAISRPEESYALGRSKDNKIQTKISDHFMRI